MEMGASEKFSCYFHAEEFDICDNELQILNPVGRITNGVNVWDRSCKFLTS